MSRVCVRNWIKLIEVELISNRTPLLIYAKCRAPPTFPPRGGGWGSRGWFFSPFENLVGFVFFEC